MLIETLREAVSNLLGSTQRSFLALLGIVIGTGAVIAMINVGSIARNETLKQFREMGTDLLAVQVSGSIGPRDLAVDVLDALPGVLPSIGVVAPLAIGGGSIAFHGASANPTQVATTASFARLARLRLREGRFISGYDRFEMYCVLGSDLAASLSQGGKAVRAGDEVRLGGYLFTVIGVLEPMLNTPILPLSVNGSLFISMDNAKRLMPSARVTNIVARVAPGATPEAAAADIARYFKPRLRGARLKIETADQLIAGMHSQMRLFELLLGATGSIALALGGVGVMNLMLVSVSERRREIGIRLAVGARRRDIQTLFLLESLILSISGGLIGIAVGAIAAWGFARYSDWEFFFVPSSASLGAGVSAAVGIFFGFYPAMMASRLDPIEALRSE
jgi:putative ABC transport system permease protein